MKFLIYTAISIDGFIARPDGDSDWVKDEDLTQLEKELEECNSVVVGRNTFEQYEGELYPVHDVENLLLTARWKPSKKHKNVKTFATPEDIVTYVNKKRYEKTLIIGGAETYSSFLTRKLVDEILLSVHPIILGKGLNVFEEFRGFEDLKLEETFESKGDLVYLRYKVK